MKGNSFLLPFIATSTFSSKFENTKIEPRALKLLNVYKVLKPHVQKGNVSIDSTDRAGIHQNCVQNKLQKAMKQKQNSFILHLLEIKTSARVVARKHFELFPYWRAFGAKHPMRYFSFSDSGVRFSVESLAVFIIFRFICFSRIFFETAA